MKLTRLLERLEYEVRQGSDGIEVTELINDSRKVTEGSVFVCISGAVSDGHDYIEVVAEKGAAAVIVERPVEAPEGTLAVAVTPFSRVTSASTVGVPRESKIWRPVTAAMVGDGIKIPLFFFYSRLIAAMIVCPPLRVFHERISEK